MADTNREDTTLVAEINNLFGAPNFFVLNGMIGRGKGVRLSKKPQVDRGYSGYQPNQGTFKPFNILDKPARVMLPCNVPKKLDEVKHGDYRYWAGYHPQEHNPAYATCRSCGQVCLNKEDRQKHSRDEGCGRLLTDAYKLLLRDRICVICDLPTQVQHFGLRLCCKDCVHEWCFKQRCPKSLMHAIQIVQRQNPRNLMA